MRARRALVLIGIVALAACGTSQARAQSLTLVFKAGDQYRYSVQSTTKYNGAVLMPPSALIQMTANETANVKAVDATGAADMVLSLTNVVLDGTPYAHPVPDVEVTIERDGKVTAINGTPMNGNNYIDYVSLAYGGKVLITAALPDHAVSPGDVWSATFDLPVVGPGASGNVHVRADSKYLRNEMFAGVNAAVVETKTAATNRSTVAAAGGQSDIAAMQTVDVTSWIDLAKHRILRSVATTTGSYTATGAGAISYTFRGTLDMKAA